MHDGRKLLAVTFDLDVGHELVVAPQLLTRAVSRLGCNRNICHIDSWSRVLRCHCQNRYRYFVIGADVGLPVLPAQVQHHGLSILLRHGLQTSTLKHLGCSLEIGQEGGCETTVIDVTDWQRNLRSITEGTILNHSG